MLSRETSRLFQNGGTRQFRRAHRDIHQTKADRGFEGFSIDYSFDVPGLTGEEADEYLESFGEEVIPLLREAL